MDLWYYYIDISVHQLSQFASLFDQLQTLWMGSIFKELHIRTLDICFNFGELEVCKCPFLGFELQALFLFINQKQMMQGSQQNLA